MQQLKLENQLCFSLYATSRLITRKYKDFLTPLELTYPQYLVLLVLWEADKIPTTFIGNKISLETNTLTPLLKRMEKQGLVVRIPSAQDERVMLIGLTEKGKALKQRAKNIPKELFCSIKPEQYSFEEIQKTKMILDNFITDLQK